MIPLLFVLSSDGTGALYRVGSVEPRFDQRLHRGSTSKVKDSASHDRKPAFASRSAGLRLYVTEVYALRVTAPVFGHNAPLKPVLNTQGAIIGHQEWPLLEDGRFTYSDLSVRYRN